jgi:homocysteine S-methyltransferase
MLSSILGYQKVVILDGATGTELEARNVQINNSKLWSAKLLLTDPTVLKDIHADYYGAGADICTTASYQVPPRIVLSMHTALGDSMI